MSLISSQAIDVLQWTEDWRAGLTDRLHEAIDPVFLNDGLIVELEADVGSNAASGRNDVPPSLGARWRRAGWQRHA
jgi:hypothetical protein